MHGPTCIFWANLKPFSLQSVVSGGEPVTGWTVVSGDPSLPKGVVAAPAPKLPAGAARHLYVGGVRAARTRVNASLVLPGGKTDKGAGGARLANLQVESRKVGGREHATAYFTPAALDWSNPIDVEFVYPVGMSEPRCSVERLERNATAGGTSIVMKQPCLWNLLNRDWEPVTVPPVWIENLRSELKAPGQWYHDRATAQILYYPLPGQDMSKESAVLAVEEVLVRHDGARNHQWQHVSFEYATWLRPMQVCMAHCNLGHQHHSAPVAPNSCRCLPLSRWTAQGGGFVEQQTGACNVCPLGVPVPSEGCGMNDDYVATPGNVQISASTDLEFVSCSFRHLGAYAASAADASQRIAWRGCSFTDISAGALMLGDFKSWNCNGGSSAYKGRGGLRANKTCTAAEPAALDSGFTVEDCEVYNIPREYKATTAITAGYVSSTTIQYNHIANTTYSGMSVGWGWGREAAGTGNNHIIGNRLESVMSTYCCGGGRCGRAFFAGLPCGPTALFQSPCLKGHCSSPDGGGIYTLGPQPNSTIERNFLFQPFRDDWPHPRQKCVDSSEHDMGNAAKPGRYSGCSGKGICKRSSRVYHSRVL
jgi:hypothetical protein